MRCAMDAFVFKNLALPVADPGFPVGGGGGGGAPTSNAYTFGKDVCENERNGSYWGGGGSHAGGTPPGSANDYYYIVTNPVNC